MRLSRKSDFEFSKLPHRASFERVLLCYFEPHQQVSTRTPEKLSKNKWATSSSASSPEIFFRITPLFFRLLLTMSPEKPPPPIASSSTLTAAPDFSLSPWRDTSNPWPEWKSPNPQRTGLDRMPSRTILKTSRFWQLPQNISLNR